MIRPSPTARGASRLGHVIAPYKGWNTRDPLAQMEPGYAPIFDNYVVEGGQPRVRRGMTEWATGLGARVDGIIRWAGAGATEELFAVADDSIFDITAGGAVGTAVVTGLTSARVDHINFAASGGNYVLCFNGADTPKTYDGTTWDDWAATGITGDISWAGQVSGRLFCGLEGYLGFYYGTAGAIAGAFTAFPLQGVARLGGGVCAMTTLSGDGGDGPQDLTVFITTEGEAIVYAGTDPSSADTWALVGRWLLPRPLGNPHRCVASHGGDALYLCDAGILPLSAFRTGADTATVIDRGALTRLIGHTWRTIADERRSSSGWQIMPLTRYSLVVANVPRGASDAMQIVISDGGAVSRWFGLSAGVWAEGLGGRVFYGDATSGGRVLAWGEQVSDDGDGIRSEALTAFSDLRTPGRQKRALRVQPVLRDARGIDMAVRVLTDWRVPVAALDALGQGAAAPNLPLLSGGGTYLEWDSGLWDVGLWDGLDDDITLPFKTAAAAGQAMAVRLQLTSGNGRPAWLSSNIVYDLGGPVG